MSSRSSWLASFLLLAGCFDSHGMVDADAAPPRADAGAAVDGASEDGGPGSLVRCTLSPVGEPIGEPCFCGGPLALARGVLYRRSVMIEVYDLAVPDEPVLVRVVEERASSAGALLVDDEGRTLYSVADIEPGVTVYDLSAPLEPARIARLDVEGVAGGALDGSTLVVVSSTDGEGGALQVVDVADRTSPRLARTIPLGGRPTSVALDGRTAAVVVARAGSGAALEMVDVESGARLATAMLDGSSFGRATVLDGDRVFVAGGERVITILSWDGSRLALAGALGDETTFGRGLALEGSILFAGGDRLRAIGVADPSRPVLLGASEGPLGDVGGLTLRGELLYVSNGNGISVVRAECE